MDNLTPAEVARALRALEEKHKNDFVPTFGIRLSDMARDCADVIDSLTAESDELRADNTSMCKEWQEAHDELGDLREKYNKLNDFEQSQCAKLLAQLATSQRRADAAVEDLKLIVDAVRETHCDETCCFACKFDCDTSITDSGCYANECPGFERDDCFEWRGPVAGEESR